jgi:hypothetical protein
VGKSLSGANISRVTGNPTIGSQPVNYFDFTPNPANSSLSPTNPAYYNGWAGEQTLTVTNSEADPSVNRDLLATSDSITRSVTTSQALVYEGKWLDDALVGIYGWRKDINTSYADSATLGDANDAQSINFNNVNFANGTQGRVEVQSRSYSLVAHLGELPGVKVRLPASFPSMSACPTARIEQLRAGLKPRQHQRGSGRASVRQDHRARHYDRDA